MVVLMLCALGWGYRDLQESKASREDVDTFKKSVGEDMAELKSDTKETLKILTDMRIAAAKKCK